MLQDALKHALSKRGDLEARTPEGSAPDAPAGPAALPDPEGSEWMRLLPSAPAGASIGRLNQETDQQIKRWKASGRQRDAKALDKARSAFLKTREKAAWRATKVRWAELELPERIYRRLKSETVQIETILAKLHTRRAAAMAVASHDELLTWLGAR